MNLFKLKYLGKLKRIVIFANILVWIYFALAFMYVSYPYQPDLLGEPNGTGYTFGGHSIALVESGFVYPFFKIIIYIEFPSFIVSTSFVKIFDPKLTGNWFFLGISEGGWILIGTMLLSFLQWYLVCCIVQWFWKRKGAGLSMTTQKKAPREEEPGSPPTNS